MHDVSVDYSARPQLRNESVKTRLLPHLQTQTLTHFLTHPSHPLSRLARLLIALRQETNGVSTATLVRRGGLWLVDTRRDRIEREGCEENRHNTMPPEFIQVSEGMGL